MFQLVSLILNKNCILSSPHLTSQLQLQISCERNIFQSNFQGQNGCDNIQSNVGDIRKIEDKNVSVLLTMRWLIVLNFVFAHRLKGESYYVSIMFQ